jgi:NAD+ diphosphatase
MSRLFDDLPLPDYSAATGFAGNRIDRLSELRTPASLGEATADARARLYLFQGDDTLLKADGSPLFTLSESEAFAVAAAETILLGWTDDGPRLAGFVPAETALVEADALVTDLRSLAIAGELDAGHLGALAQARALLNWHQRHRYCSACGQPTAVTAAGYRRDCAACGAQHFPRTDPVVIMMTIHTGADGVERALLGRQSRFPPGMYSCLAGFVEPGETLEDAVRRETREESGVIVGRVRYHASQPWPFPSSLMIGCLAEALSEDVTPDEAELEDCRWFSRDEVRAMISGTHPDGLLAPTPMAIAHHLLHHWAMADDTAT